MKRMLMGVGMMALSAVGVMDLGASRAQAQLPGESVVYETVSPGMRTVTYGERVRVRRGLFKTVVKERPVRYVTTTPPVVRETRVIQTAPVIQQQVVQPAPMFESQVIQPEPIVQTRYLPSAPVYQTRMIQVNPLIQTRYYVPYP